MTPPLTLTPSAPPPPPPDPRRHLPRRRRRVATFAIGPAGRSRAADRFANSTTIVADSAVSPIRSSDERPTTTTTHKTSTAMEAAIR
jgi:hypothetical protein